MKLIAQIVGRNESDRYLSEVLEHLRGFADEIVFTDDCSNDDTYSIAENYGCYTYRTPENLFTKNEGELRQLAWDNLKNHASVGDWVLAIDCDEKLYHTNDKFSFRELLSLPQYSVMNIVFYHMWNENQYRVDKEWRPNNSSRLFRYFPSGTFNRRKLACGSEPEYVQKLVNSRKYLLNSGLVMQHLGYMRDEDKLNKYDRYSKLDGGNFHAKKHIESIIDEKPKLRDWTFG